LIIEYQRREWYNRARGATNFTLSALLFQMAVPQTRYNVTMEVLTDT